MADPGIVIAGGGLGAVAAALSATAAGGRVTMLSEDAWLGGQVSTQGVSALDEHRLIETAGGTARYMAFRDRVRDHYRRSYNLCSRARGARALNPGCLESERGLAFEPAAGAAVLEDMLSNAAGAGFLTILRPARVVDVDLVDGRVAALRVRFLDSGLESRIESSVVIDATELGDLLPLAGVPYRTGVESYADTGEPSAPEEAIPRASQAITYVFAVEFRRGESHVIPCPQLYAEMRRTHPFTFNGYKMLERGFFGSSFLEYRRILDSRVFHDSKLRADVFLVNWLGTDYAGETLIDQPAETVALHLHRAKQLALSFLYWLQTEAPRDEGGQGYPELMLRKDIMGTEDGLSRFPYVRESRRVRGLQTVREQDVIAGFNTGARARLWPDSVGCGWYYRIDLHRSCHTKLRLGSGGLVLPFQIPLGALVNGHVPNLIAGAKNISTTHISNGAYRYHPIEWSIGEAAGVLAVEAPRAGADPAEFAVRKQLLHRLQLRLLDQGNPLYWFDDLPFGHEAFPAAQFLAVQGIISGKSSDLHFRPDAPVQLALSGAWIERARRNYRLRPAQVAELRERCRKGTIGQSAMAVFEVALGALGSTMTRPSGSTARRRGTTAASMPESRSP